MDEILTEDIIYLFGFGSSNQAVYNYILTRNTKQKFVIIEENTVNIDNVNVSVMKKEDVLDSNIEINILFKSPGIKPSETIILKAKYVLNDIELAYKIKVEKKLNTKFISVTGSNGKTSTVEFIKELLINNGYKTEAVGNIGLSPLEVIEQEYDYLIFELSSFQLINLTDYRSDSTILLNITEDHLDYHETIENYAQDKLKLLSLTKKKSFIYVDQTFGIFLNKEQSDQYKLNIYQSKFDQFYSEKYSDLLMIKTALNKRNILSAKLLNDYLKLNNEIFCNTLSAIKPLENRLEVVLKKNNIIWINDSKATNSDSTLSAIENFKKENLILIVGGSEKGENYNLLLDELKDLKLVLGIGTTGQQFTKFKNMIYCETLNKAVKVASQNAKKNDIILLSPAAASFDQFKNYGERGKIFKELVKKENNI